METIDLGQFEKQVSRTLIQLGKKAPFFSVLALFTSIKPMEAIKVAGTDGKNIYLNPYKWNVLTDGQRQTVLCHELLHAALLHLPRRQSRERRLWNIAADIVVNGILRTEHFDMSLPHINDWRLEDKTVEAVYEELLDDGQPTNGDDPNGLQDLLDPPEKETKESLSQHWQKAMDTASKIAGSMPGKIKREYDRRQQATSLNWRDLLWRFLSPSQFDYAGYDRRFIGQGLYLDALDGSTLKAALAIDTSGSIGEKELSIFQREIKEILGAYPSMEITLYYADYELYGPHVITHATTQFPQPEGGGGTSFVPFFEAIGEASEPFQVAIYLTDGWGDFPDQEPRLPVLWVLTEHSYSSIPFGQIVKL